MNKNEILDLMSESLTDVLSGITEEIERSAKLGRGSVSIHIDKHTTALTSDNQYYISHELSQLGYNVTLDQHLEKITIGWF